MWPLRTSRLYFCLARPSMGFCLHLLPDKLVRHTKLPCGSGVYDRTEAAGLCKDLPHSLQWLHICDSHSLKSPSPSAGTAFDKHSDRSLMCGPAESQCQLLGSGGVSALAASNPGVQGMAAAGWHCCLCSTSHSGLGCCCTPRAALVQVQPARLACIAFGKAFSAMVLGAYMSHARHAC